MTTSPDPHAWGSPDPDAWGSPDPDAWGIELRYRNSAKVWHDAPQDTVRKILEAMGADVRVPFRETDVDPVVVVRSGYSHEPAGDWRLTTEQGEVVTGHGRLPDDLALGYHDLEQGDGGRTRLIVAPPACPDPSGVREWGWAMQLYATRSRSSWGMGDLGDLRDFGGVAKRQSADSVLVNPLHATLPGVPQEPSPYFPSSREFRNPLYIRVEDVPGAGSPDVDIAELAREGRALNCDRRIDRDAVWRLKSEALERIWQHTKPSPAFEGYLRSQGESLQRYAVFCTISENHGRPWHDWPADLRDPSSSAVAAYATSHADRVRFHQWLQWLLDVQLKEAAGQIDIIQDLAIGVDPAGADAWLWQDVVALGMRVGAPPDSFNQRGQNWGLPPLNPWKLRELGYEPFIETVRSGLRHSRGLRIDHVMGLFRLFWIPEDESPTQGTYVRYRWDELLAIVALESHRAGALVVGEDLGTVEPYMREELVKENVLSYRLVWFEDKPPTHFPANSLGAVTTHDLPTIAGLFSGSDLVTQTVLGTDPNEAATHAMKNRVEGWLGLGPEPSMSETVCSVHDLLAHAPSVMVTATIEDALALEERPNYPGTTDEWPNWSVALPVPIEELAVHSGFIETARALEAGR